MSKIAFLFPGQGAQTVGMAKQVAAENPVARGLFDKASAILGYDLLDVCVNGPAERLNSTVVSQPALFVAGLAAVEVLRATDPAAVDGCAGACGLSLGEYTALVFAGSMTFEDGLRVVKARGEAMQAAAEASRGTMVSVLSLELAKLEDVVQKARAKGRVRVANHLCPGNLVVSGDVAACEEVERLATEAGALSTIRLAVAGAFHTELMAPAIAPLTAALNAATIKPPRIPVPSNVDAQPHQDPAELRQILVRQVTEPVLWERCVRRLLDDGFDKFYELGPGRVLAGLMKRIHRKADITNITV